MTFHTQSFLLGIMAAWTPSLILLAWMLRRKFMGHVKEEEISHD